jgi:hypothetical protein
MNRAMLNYIGTPTGPAVGRSGTMFMNTAYRADVASYLIPFVFDDGVDASTLEFSENRLRLFTDDGLLVYAAVAITITSEDPFVFDAPTLNANVGDQVAFSDFPPQYNLNGVVGNIVAKAGTVYTVDTQFPEDLTIPSSVKASRVYHVASPYTSAQAKELKDTQVLDVLRLTTDGVKPYKLQRYDTYDWRFEAIAFKDGPYLDINETSTTLTPTSTGKALPNMTSNNLPSGYVASGSGTLSSTYDFFRAFDDPTDNTWWDSGVNQAGTLQIQVPSGFVCDGYSIYIPTDNQNATYASKDYGPSDWSFEGSNDGANWTTLDRQNDYVLYDGHKSSFFELPNTTSYTYYRLVVKALVRNGTQNCRVGSLILRSASSRSITFNASSTTGINGGSGFLSTDVGRHLRVRGRDNTWRWLIITDVNSTTQIVATLQGEPFSDTQPVAQWRLGLWSDTTGYPTYSYFYDDRIWYLGGGRAQLDILVGSVVGSYDNMSPSTDKGVVLDTSSLVLKLNTPRLARGRWIVGTRKGLIVGTGARPYLIAPAEGSGKAITQGNVRVEKINSRGSADVQPAEIDSQVLFVPRSGRGLREMAFSFENDDYKSPSMSLLASHLTVSPFEELAYAEEPYGVLWVRRQDGRIVALVYNREENVIGWAPMSFPDTYTGDDVLSEAVIESICVQPTVDQLQDVIWIACRRTIGGNTVRYIEKMMPAWDFGAEQEYAHYLDSALRYEGPETSVIYGLRHLEGKEVFALVDGIPQGPFTVAEASILLNTGGSNVLVGIGFEAYVETMRLENGAADGTAQGKEKRTNNLSALLWDSRGGSIGHRDEETDALVWTPIVYPQQNGQEIETTTLYSGIVGPEIMPPGYNKDGTIAFRRSRNELLPLNVVALMPQLNTQDR